MKSKQLQMDEHQRRSDTTIREKRATGCASLLAEMRDAGCSKYVNAVTDYMVERKTYAEILADINRRSCGHRDLVTKHLAHLE